MTAFVELVAVFADENANLCLFTVGFCLFGFSLAHISGPLAGAVCGAVLMGMGVWPYLRRKG